MLNHGDQYPEKILPADDHVDETDVDESELGLLTQVCVSRLEIKIRRVFFVFIGVICFAGRQNAGV